MTNFPLYLSFTVHYFYAQISSFTQSFIHKNCFWALLSTLFLFWEIFRGNFQLEPDVCRSPYTWSLNSNDKITKGCFTNNKMNFEKQLDWQVLEKKDNCNPLHSFSSLSIRAFFSSGGSRRGARGAQVPPPPYFLNQTVCMQGQSFNNFENDRINLSVSESQHSWVARRDYTNVTGQFCLGNDFQICLRFSNFAFRGMNGPQEPVFGPEGKFFKTSQTWQS